MEEATEDGKVLEMTKKMKLTNEERLEIQNLNLQRQLLESNVQKQIVNIDNRQNQLVAQVNERLGIDITKMMVNLETGDVTPPPEENRATRRASASKARKTKKS